MGAGYYTNARKWIGVSRSDVVKEACAALSWSVSPEATSSVVSANQEVCFEVVLLMYLRRGRTDTDACLWDGCGAIDRLGDNVKMEERG